MGNINYIWVKNKRHYYYETYNDWETALKQAKRHKKKNKCQYFILQVEDGFWFPEKRFKLYLDKCIRIW